MANMTPDEVLASALAKTTNTMDPKLWRERYNNIFTTKDGKGLLRYNLDNPPVIKGGAIFVVTRVPELFNAADLSDNFSTAFMSYVKTAPNGENATLTTEDVEGSAYAHTSAAVVTGSEQQPTQDLSMTFKHDGLYIMSMIMNLWVNTLINMHTGESEVARNAGIYPGDNFGSMDYMLVKNSSTNYDDNVSSIQYFRNVKPTLEVGNEELEITVNRELMQEISVTFKGQYVHKSTLAKMEFKTPIEKQVEQALITFRKVMLDSKLSVGDLNPPVMKLNTK